MKLVGKVTENEKVELQVNFKKKLALQSLFRTISDMENQNDLYVRVVNDLSPVEFAIQEWWANKSKEYNWESSESGSWSIDFETNEIYLTI